MPRGEWSSLASPSPAAGPERHLLAAELALCLEEHAFLNETRAVSAPRPPGQTTQCELSCSEQCSSFTDGHVVAAASERMLTFHRHYTLSFSCSSKNVQTSSVCGKEGTLARVTRCRRLSQTSLSNAFLPHVDGESAGLQAFLLVESGWTWGCRTPLLPSGQGPRLCRAGDPEP